MVRQHQNRRRKQTFRQKVNAIVAGHVVGNIFGIIALGITVHLFLKFHEKADCASIIIV